MSVARPFEEQGSKIVYKLYIKLSDGCDGKYVGMGGSLSFISMARVLRELDIQGSNFMDFGCAHGQALLAAWMSGAFSVVGYELPGNKAQKFIFDAVLAKMAAPAINHAQWIPQDIDQVFFVFDLCAVDDQFHFGFCSQMTDNVFVSIPQLPEIPIGSNTAFAFWVGMPFLTQLRILELCAVCDTMKAIAVFRDRKWPTPGEGRAYAINYPSRMLLTIDACLLAVLAILNDFGAVGSQKWYCDKTMRTTMLGSRERKTAWIFKRL